MERTLILSFSIAATNCLHQTCQQDVVEPTSKAGTATPVTGATTAMGESGRGCLV